MIDCVLALTAFAATIGVGVSVARATELASAHLAHDYPVQPIPFTAVHLNDCFWAPRIETNRVVTIPYAFQQCEQTGRMYNFERAAAVLRGEELKDKKPPGYPFDDSDPYKILEGASYALSVHPDPKLRAYLDNLIVKIAAAQEPDGYLYTTRTIDPLHPHEWSGTQRWVKEEQLSHELYNLGHLFEAAVAHYSATGDRSLLNVALKAADLLDRTFGPGKQSIWPGHQITEMGLVKLYRVTGNENYLQLAKFLLDQRGRDGTGGAEHVYNQADKPVREQTEAVGHAVRATYMYSGMADVASLTGDQDYLHAIDAIWENCVGRKLYITGGIGAKHQGEAFGADYELPNLTAYCETCAAIGNVYWNHRLFLLHGDAKYIDVMERSLYNGLISGVSLDGRTFFYPNPLESAGDVQRSPWFGCACCPGNITRFLASVSGYVYAQQADALYVNLFAAGSADVTLANGSTLQVVQETQYPWNGDVKITINPQQPGAFAVKLRIPGWARNQPVPSDLYYYADAATEQATLTVNGQSVSAETNKGYATIQREWKRGDTIELYLPMPVRRVLANEKVQDDVGRVALERGPIVYCVEGIDAPDGHVRKLSVSDTATFSTEFKPNLLGGVTVVEGANLTGIPYATWANRGKAEMAVWLQRTHE